MLERLESELLRWRSACYFCAELFQAKLIQAVLTATEKGIA